MKAKSFNLSLNHFAVCELGMMTCRFHLHQQLT